MSERQTIETSLGDAPLNVEMVPTGLEPTQAPPTDGVFEAPKADELILGKFKSQSDLEAAYKQLESKLGQPKDSTESKEGLEGLSIEPAAEPATEDVNIWETARNEFNQTGVITDDSMGKLKALNIPDTMIVDFVEGQKARGREVARTVYESAGGEAEFRSLAEWAAKSLPEGLRAEYNAMLTSGDPNKAIMAVDALQSRRSKGSEPTLRTGDAPASKGSASAFQSQEEMAEAMADPRYRTDESYRRSVSTRIPTQFSS